MKSFFVSLFSILFLFSKAQSKNIIVGNSSNIYGSTFNQSNNTIVKNYSNKKTINFYYVDSYKRIDLFNILSFYKNSFAKFQSENTINALHSGLIKKTIIEIDSLTKSSVTSLWQDKYYLLNIDIINLVFLLLEDNAAQKNSVFLKNEFGNVFALSNEIACNTPKIEILDNQPFVIRNNFSDTSILKNATRIFPFVNGYARYIQNGKMGLVNTVGKIIFYPTFDEIWDYSEGWFLTRNDTEFYFLDSTGKKHLNLYEYESINPFKDGYAKVKFSNGYFGFIDVNGIKLKVTYKDASGKSSSQNEFEETSEFGTGKAFIKDLSLYKSTVINTKGEILQNIDEDFFSGYNENGISVIGSKYLHTYYLFDNSFTKISKPYQDLTRLNNLGFVGYNYYQDTINKRVDTLLYLFDQDGVLRYSNLKASSYSDFDEHNVILKRGQEQKTKFGVMNKHGIIVIDFIYDKIDFISDKTMLAYLEGRKIILRFNEDGFLIDN